MKRRSRCPVMARATISSATPPPYISAVSISVMPSSIPSFSAASSSAARRRSSPMCQVPWPKAGMLSPLGSFTDGRLSLIAGLRLGAFAAQEDEPRGAVDALIYESEPCGQWQFLARRDLDDDERVRGQPAGADE